MVKAELHMIGTLHEARTILSIFLPHYPKEKEKASPLIPPHWPKPPPRHLLQSSLSLKNLPLSLPSIFSLHSPSSLSLTLSKMAASATISSYISTINNHLTSKSIPSLQRVSTARVPRANSMPHLTQQLYHTVHITPKPRNFGRILATVSQEEAPATAVEEGEVVEAVKEEEVHVEESEAGGEEETVTEEQPQQNTKLYFGNLPYNCDSSQLAGIVQECATPEMVEVIFFFFFCFQFSTTKFR